GQGLALRYRLLAVAVDLPQASVCKGSTATPPRLELTSTIPTSRAFFISPAASNAIFVWKNIAADGFYFRFALSFRMSHHAGTVRLPVRGTPPRHLQVGMGDLQWH